MSLGTHTLTDGFLLSTLTDGWERIWLNRNVDGDLEYRISPGTRWCAKGARVSVGEGATIGVASRVHDFVVIGAGVATGSRCVLEHQSVELDITGETPGGEAAKLSIYAVKPADVPGRLADYERRLVAAWQAVAEAEVVVPADAS